MKDRFIKLFTSVGNKTDIEATREWNTIVSQYSEPHRRYHTMLHIAQCLDQLDRGGWLFPRSQEWSAEERNVIELALWYHDFYYDTQNECSNNELNSANRFNFLGFDKKISEPVWGCIVATREHNGVTETERFVCDIDLISLSAPWNEFYVNQLNVREEYKNVSDELFYSTNTKILQALLNRKSIYQTEDFIRLYERGARTNITKIINGRSI
jgi:predicted metal-dependent HD superfamily phosphohydrolase